MNTKDFTMEYTIVKCAKDEVPYKLLLEADETVEAINKYIFQCDVYMLKTSAEAGADAIAVFALKENSKEEIELKNIAVAEHWRSKGIGKYILNYIKNLARNNGYQRLEVGTSDTGYQQLRFYEANGFVRSGIRRDFFLLNYPEPIFENGEQMRDMIILTLQL
ncbi:hypothetical protein TRVA0_020S02564 [Trichomonascus vanleenenianus]|uniref:uncharacterized protein n=1 Tax=Trichomonascus vanleenenianus TaxID=2268995 RepID=UPI003ECA4C55